MDINGLVQGCSNHISNAQKLLLSRTKPSLYEINFNYVHLYGTYL